MLEMTTDQIFQDLTQKLIELPDLTGLNRCAGFFMLYQGIMMLKQKLSEESEQHKNEILVLQSRIQELEGQIERKGANENGSDFGRDAG